MISTSIIRSLYLRPSKYSIPCFSATNSVPKTDVSTDICLFETHLIDAIFKNTIKSDRDLLEDWSPAWSLSTNNRQSTSLPCGTGALRGFGSWIRRLCCCYCIYRLGNGLGPLYTVGVREYSTIKL